MRVGLALVMTCAAAVSLTGAGGRPEDIASRTRGAARVVVARVSEVQARFDVNEYGDRVIVSQAWLDVEETLKGTAVPGLSVDVEGGTVGDLTLQVSDMPTLRRGDRAMFFLDARVSSSGAHRLYRRGLGVVKLDAGNRVPGTKQTLDQIRATVRSVRR